MKTEGRTAEMRPDERNKSTSVSSGGNSSEMAEAQLAWTLQRNASTPSPSHTEESLVRGNGIIPGAVAAAVFIAFLLALYAVLWKCMVSPPQRKRRTMRGRLQRAPL
ncbi:uncharacterized protein LOC142989172 [Genypterus blacodes]|uniref:uncharacterized protein LOC142989172 n=1 Tax=Genypterus blacodes TaxID=154954 RepID=UPI003F76F03C